MLLSGAYWSGSNMSIRQPITCHLCVTARLQEQTVESVLERKLSDDPAADPPAPPEVQCIFNALHVVALVTNVSCSSSIAISLVQYLTQSYHWCTASRGYIVHLFRTLKARESPTTGHNRNGMMTYIINLGISRVWIRCNMYRRRKRTCIIICI